MVIGFPSQCPSQTIQEKAFEVPRIECSRVGRHYRVDCSGDDDPCYFVIRHAERAQRFRNTQCLAQTDQSLHYAIAKLGLLSQENGPAFASDNSNRPARARDGSRRDPQVEGFRPGELLISNCRKAAAVAGVLHTAPCQFRIKIVTAVHEPGTGLDPLTD